MDLELHGEQVMSVSHHCSGRLQTPNRGLSREKVGHDATVYVGETKITSRVSVGEPFMIETEEMKHGRMEIVK